MADSVWPLIYHACPRLPTIASCLPADFVPNLKSHSMTFHHSCSYGPLYYLLEKSYRYRSTVSEMSCNTELEKKLSPVSDPASSSPVYSPGTSASSTTNVNRWKSQGGTLDKEGGTLKAGTNGRGPNEASSSELSIRSETPAGTNGDSLLTTDSDCCASLVGKNFGKKTRPKSRKRRAKPLIPGYANDWESNDSWTSEKAQEDCTVVAAEIETKRRKIKSLQQKNRRLKVRHSRLKAAIKEMKANMAQRD